VATGQADVPLSDFGRLFGNGGVYDAFFRTELAPLVDTSRGAWAWRTDSTGAPVGGSAALLRQFEAAGRIRDAFFPTGTSSPEVQFTLTPIELDTGTKRFVLEMDGQSFDYQFGPLVSRPAVWPGKTSGAAATFEEFTPSARPNVPFPGPWAFFRLLDAGQLQRETDSTRTRFVFTVAKGGHVSKWMIEARSIRNPFVSRDLQQFSCQY
jgi:type VI secretion system protein ImpL